MIFSTNEGKEGGKEGGNERGRRKRKKEKHLNVFLGQRFFDSLGVQRRAQIRWLVQGCSASNNFFYCFFSFFI